MKSLSRNPILNPINNPINAQAAKRKRVPPSPTSPNRPVLVTNSQEVTPPPDSPHSGDNTGDGGGYARTADLAKAAHALNEFCKECFKDKFSSGKFICTAHEIFHFEKGAESLHLAEYPAKVHCSDMANPAASNPCCELII